MENEVFENIYNQSHNTVKKTLNLPLDTNTKAPILIESEDFAPYTILNDGNFDFLTINQDQLFEHIYEISKRLTI